MTLNKNAQGRIVSVTGAYTDNDDEQLGAALERDCAEHCALLAQLNTRHSINEKGAAIRDSKCALASQLRKCAEHYHGRKQVNRKHARSRAEKLLSELLSILGAIYVDDEGGACDFASHMTAP